MHMLTWCESDVTQGLPPAYTELIQRDRWVCWRDQDGKKVPYNAKRPRHPANSSDPRTWMPYKAAQQAVSDKKFDGIGFVLNGDGVVAIDIDDCISDGCIDPRAMKVMEQFGCKLVEVSPSGTGLHGYGLSAPIASGRMGQYMGVRVELYSDRRYMTVTGQVVIGEGLVELPNFREIAENIRPELTESTEAKETKETTNSRGRVSNFASIEAVEIPESCLPHAEGTRNRYIFRLARYLKAHFPESHPDELAPVVRRWHTLSLPYIRTKLLIHFEN